MASLIDSLKKGFPERLHDLTRMILAVILITFLLSLPSSISFLGFNLGLPIAIFQFMTLAFLGITLPLLTVMIIWIILSSIYTNTRLFRKTMFQLKYYLDSI